ncbi:unnamed protein product [Vitrella brassicaformis CCMP3155]|uniref:Uncharacterized protein n=2 Tax=Vitrella brassicaformis TaxID=1169539 RepID=A0A0G4EW61_VITBC|nr:unnamed protein product [Vitrella brassicaformis CCMP3155]|eukprot:CEM02693.1 unnamed protein product [Vitrella brassicaformis CCMP3155]
MKPTAHLPTAAGPGRNGGTPGRPVASQVVGAKLEDSPVKLDRPAAEKLVLESMLRSNVDVRKELLTKTYAETSPKKKMLDDVEKTLVSIFHFYSSEGGSNVLANRTLKSSKLQRMAIDSCLFNESLTPAKLDLLFTKVTGKQPKMSLRQFLDVMVLAANVKYGTSLQAPAALMKLYEEHLSSFCADPLAPPPVDGEWVSMLKTVAPLLERFFRGYFPSWVALAASTLEAQQMKAWSSFLTDFEITPALIGKPQAYAALRESLAYPPHPSLLPLTTHASQPAADAKSGQMTFPHFLMGLLHIARKLSPQDSDTLAFVRLLAAMDTSKGWVVFFNTTGNLPVAAKHPGAEAAGPTSRFGKLLPAALLREAGILKTPVVEKGSSASNNGGGGVARGDERGGRGVGVGEGRRRGGREEGVVFDEPMTDEQLLLSKRLFLYYTSVGDPLNRTHLSSAKFARFLRETGIVASRPSLQQTKLTELTNDTTNQDGSNIRPLPLRVLPAPALTQVQADLLFVRHTKAATTLPKTGLSAVPSQGDKGDDERRSGVGAGMVRSTRHHMELHQWLKALKELSREVHAAMESENPSPMDSLTTHILKPLCDATVAKDHTAETAEVKAINTDPLVKELLASIRPRVKQLFTHYARGGHSLPLSGFQQLCADFDVSELLAPVTIQRTYWSAVSAGNEEDRKIEANEMSFTAFQLAVVTLASKAPVPEFTDSEKSQCVSAAHEHFKIAPHLAPAAYASETYISLLFFLSRLNASSAAARFLPPPLPTAAPETTWTVLREVIEGKPGQTNGTTPTPKAATGAGTLFALPPLPLAMAPHGTHSRTRTTARRTIAIHHGGTVGVGARAGAGAAGPAADRAAEEGDKKGSGVVVGGWSDIKAALEELE